MRIYETKHPQPLKWIIAILVFMIVLSVTFSDVYGFWTTKPNDGSQPPPQNKTSQIQFDQPMMDPPASSCPNPPAVPEPATLILLGSGLAAMRLLRRNKT